jgi:LysR family glycine cleavage system transcriptional activator
MKRLPPFRALEAFVVVAQRQTLKAASADLSLSPSALSRRVQTLEAHVGKALFTRVGGEFRLTDDGRRLLERLAPAFDDLSGALDDLRSTGAETLALGVMPGFATGWLLPRLSRFRALHPDVVVSLETGPELLPRLGTALDAVIAVGGDSGEGDYRRELPPQTVVALCSPALMAGAPPLAGPEDVRLHTILLHRNLTELLEAWLDGHALSHPPGRIEHYDSGPMLLEAAASGLGVALSFDIMATSLVETGRLMRLGRSVASPLNYYFTARKPALRRKGVRQFHDWLFAELSPEIAA